MLISVDIRCLFGPATGVHAYVRNVLDCLQDIDETNEYVLIETGDSGYGVRNWRWKRLTLETMLPGTIWTHVRLPRILKSLGVDVHWGPAYINPIRRIPGVALVTTIHDFTYVRYPKTVRRQLLWVLRYLTPRVLKNSAAIIVISNFVKEELDTVFGQMAVEKATVIVPGKPSWHSTCSRGNTKMRGAFLFFAGNFEPRKNLLNLIRALEIARLKGFEVQLKIAGPKGWHNRSIMNYLEASPVRPQVHILGYVTDGELQDLYQSCKALVLPSLYEGFGLPVLEALAAGCLVLTSKDTVMEEIAGDNALYFDPGNPHDMAEVIISIYRPGFDTSDVLRGRERVLNRYDWHTSAAEHLRVLTKACKEG